MDAGGHRWMQVDAGGYIQVDDWKSLHIDHDLMVDHVSSIRNFPSSFQITGFDSRQQEHSTKTQLIEQLDHG